MKIEIDKYVVDIKFHNNFNKQQITPFRINLIENYIKQNMFEGEYNIYSDDNFPIDIETDHKWENENFFGKVFDWKVVDYKNELYPDYKINDKNIILAYSYNYDNLMWYEDNVHEIRIYKDKKIDKYHTLISIGYISINLLPIYK